MSKETKTAEEQLIRDLIDKYMNFKTGAESTSIQHYGEYGAVSGSLFLNVKAMMREFANHRLTQQQEINAELKQEIQDVWQQHHSYCEHTAIEIKDLKKQNAELLEIAKAFLILSKESTGVTGWHRNGDIAYWDEFDLVKMAEKALNTPPKN